MRLMKITVSTWRRCCASLKDVRLQTTDFRSADVCSLLSVVYGLNMISPETVWQKIWPNVEILIQGTLSEDDEAVQSTLHPKGSAFQLYDLFGRYVFELLVKTVLGRQNLSVTRAIESDGGKAVHLELVWPEPGVDAGSYSAADLVAVKLRKYRQKWLVFEINPAAVDLPLTEARAAAILMNTRSLNPDGELPKEAWLLPIALYAGALQITLQEKGMKDEVERLLLPGLQKQGYGLLSLLNGRKLWRDFTAKQKGPIDQDQASAWAAAVEFIVSEQAMRELTQAAVAQHYNLSMMKIVSKIGQIKKALDIQGLDERYTAVQRQQLVVKKQEE